MYKIYYIKNGIKHYLKWSLEDNLHYSPEISKYVITDDNRNRAEWCMKREYDRGITEKLYMEQ